VTHPASDRHALANFPLAWRWLQETHDPLPDDVLDDIQPLSRTAARHIAGEAARRCREGPLGEFTDSFSAEGDHADSVHERLLLLPIPPESRVFVSWASEVAIDTSWRTFRTHWDAFCYPSSDNVTIWTPGEPWTVCYRHFEFIEVQLPPGTKVSAAGSAQMQFWSVVYSTIRGSDPDRDGMFLELYAAAFPDGSPVGEWFYSDLDGAMTFTEYSPGTPSAVHDWFRWQAERYLPPRADAI
jgi:hypothetical protein